MRGKTNAGHALCVFQGPKNVFRTRIKYVVGNVTVFCVGERYSLENQAYSTRHVPFHSINMMIGCLSVV